MLAAMSIKNTEIVYKLALRQSDRMVLIACNSYCDLLLITSFYTKYINMGKDELGSS